MSVREACPAESPVTSGTDATKIDVSNADRQVTHMLPVTHADFLDNLKRAAAQDKEVSADDTEGQADWRRHPATTRTSAEP